MSFPVHKHSDCRLCGSRNLTLVLQLAATPPANAFVAAAARDQEQARFPLDVFFCDECGHVQLCDVVDPAVLFENYVYVSGTSPVFVRHFEDYAEAVMDFRGSERSGLAVDIGSNDGTLLRFFKNAGFEVLGIDPARDIAAQASADGIETLAEFFSADTGRRLRDERGPAMVVTANNVFAHIDDLGGVANGVCSLLHDDGLFVFEVSYLVDVYEKTLFDTIYHEHLAYHTVKPLDRFLGDHGLELIRVDRIDTHGGSIRCYAQPVGAKRTRDTSVDARIANEAAIGLDRADTLKGFAAQIDSLKAELLNLIEGVRGDGKRLAAFGAPAKATTLMYHFDLGPELVEFIVDDSPLKQGLFSPGMHIPVLPSDALYERRPDYAIVLAWNFAEPIMRNHQRFVVEGGHFIVPLPRPVII